MEHKSAAFLTKEGKNKQKGKMKEKCSNQQLKYILDRKIGKN